MNIPDGQILNEVRCYDKYSNIELGKFNHQFLLYLDKRTFYHYEDFEDMRVQYRVKLFDLTNSYDELTKNKEFQNMLNKTSFYSDLIECKTRILTNENKILTNCYNLVLL